MSLTYKKTQVDKHKFTLKLIPNGDSSIWDEQKKIKIWLDEYTPYANFTRHRASGLAELIYTFTFVLNKEDAIAFKLEFM